MSDSIGIIVLQAMDRYWDVVILILGLDQLRSTFVRPNMRPVRRLPRPLLATARSLLMRRHIPANMHMQAHYALASQHKTLHILALFAFAYYAPQRY